jgi:hypothetical protein
LKPFAGAAAIDSRVLEAATKRSFSSKVIGAAPSSSNAAKLTTETACAGMPWFPFTFFGSGSGSFCGDFPPGSGFEAPKSDRMAGEITGALNSATR